MFAALVNWRMRAFGKKVIRLYLVVLMLLWGLYGLFYLPNDTLICPVHTLVNNSPIYLLSMYNQYKNDIRLFTNLQLNLISHFHHKFMQILKFNKFVLHHFQFTKELYHNFIQILFLFIFSYKNLTLEFNLIKNLNKVKV